MKINFRNHIPIRKYSKNYSTYTSYKKYLAEDFNYRCGYTDCPDFWFGGKANFHIDHFIPWKNHLDQPSLKTDYSNLVYCCSYVNILKSNDETNYLDPCQVDYNEHFFRNISGQIKPNTESVAANYMYSKLKMYMSRYQIIWMLDNLFDKLESLSNAMEKTKNPILKENLKSAMCELVPIVVKYKCYLSESQRK